MLGRIDYDIEKYQFTEAGETSRLREQWREVYQECRQLQAGAEERLRIALLNVDYVTSFELPFRLLLVRAPQLIADVRETLQLSRKAAVFNGKRYGCVYSLKQDLQAVPESFHYHLTNRIRRVEATGQTAAPYQQIARVKIIIQPDVVGRLAASRQRSISETQPQGARQRPRSEDKHRDKHGR